tara:strand:- start:306 stop:608 length:303 start_codon:yes stop_codon:yes gene_type:complete
MGQGCRSSGLLDTTDTTVYSGRCKLVSIHGYNDHGSNASTVTIYDNIASSGKVVATFILPAKSAGGGGLSMEFDMHSVICHTGLRFTFSAGTPKVTIEFA